MKKNMKWRKGKYVQVVHGSQIWKPWPSSSKTVYGPHPRGSLEIVPECCILQAHDFYHCKSWKRIWTGGKENTYKL